MSTSAVSNRAQGTGVALKDSRQSRRRTDNLVGWAFFAPFGLFFGLFLIWPILFGLYLSFTGTTLTGAGGDFVGFENYAEALGDADMWRSMLNTLWFTVLSTIPLVLIALIMALLVDLGLPGQWLWRLSFFMPFLLASTVVSLFWIWLFNPQLGLINDMLAPFGVEPIAWLQDPQWAMHGVVIATVWWTVGFNFLLYLAALQNIPEQQYEAASIDGAGKWRQLFSITIPQLAPTTALIVILQVLASLKIFDQVYQMTSGGPGGTTRTAVLYIFETGFTGYRFGYSAAISFVFFAVIILVSIIQIRITASRRPRS
ncbi:sugar ABC transporter permease [Mycetocola manganoxydans]|uniref:Sugar ABC transporter permease n=1 Tax=Mycetocola manganoxydans TaxID=699879 RepID=A0A3L6ZNF5_9MICO|nr:sugar ABC transporter permease [Mycetocola manganoxydans]RLP69430.1 sugar ABC transporter permease [Mycetocola manganoxydans]GHD50562.1 sugar ABC transporter permease [Mycetocola manganoxydans]